MKIPSIRQKTFISKSASDIYNLLTTSEGWNSWFTDDTILEINNGKGFITLVWNNWGPQSLTLTDGGPILEAIPNKLFSFEWSPAKDLTTIVKFELEEIDNGTYVTVTDSGYNKENLAALVDCAAGWGEALTLLKMYMEYGITTKQ